MARHSALGRTRIQRWVSTFLNLTSIYPTLSYHNCRICPRLQALIVRVPPFPPPLPTPLIPLLPLLRRCVECYQTLIQSSDIPLEHACLLIPRLLSLALPPMVVSLPAVPVLSLLDSVARSFALTRPPLPQNSRKSYQTDTSACSQQPLNPLLTLYHRKLNHEAPSATLSRSVPHQYNLFHRISSHLGTAWTHRVPAAHRSSPTHPRSWQVPVFRPGQKARFTHTIHMLYAVSESTK